MTIKDLKEFAELNRGLEEITPDLIEELSKTGITQEELKFLKSQGMQYNRKRESFVGPVMTSWDS